MLKRSDAWSRILSGRPTDKHFVEAEAFACANIALIKYWGKRDQELNLPKTSSLSISLNTLGTRTRLKKSFDRDSIYLNGKALSEADGFVQRLCRFLDLFRSRGEYFEIHTQNTIPTAAGLASSASGFAALIKALNRFYGWKLNTKEMSILARMGSGSACRSIEPGFVLWHAGDRSDGMDSYAERLDTTWPELRIGIVLLSTEKKSISSRRAMQRTVDTSILYRAWPQKVDQDLLQIKKALLQKNFSLLGKTAESNALSMHATGLAAWPPLCYWQPSTLQTIHQIWSLRQQGFELFFTMDAGANVKLLFKARDKKDIETHFPNMQTVDPFA